MLNRRSPKFKKVPSIYSVAFFCLAVFLVLKEARLVPGKSSNVIALHSKIKKVDATDGKSKEVLDLALVDSITSIVQSYYVDSDRIDPFNLFKGTLQTLASALPGAVYQENSAEVTLSIKGNKVAFKNEIDMDSQSLVEKLGLLHEFCNSIQINSIMNQSSKVILGTEPSISAILMNSLLSSLDAHSNLMSPEAYRELRQGTEGEFGGLGVIVGVKDHLLTVLKPIPKSPAARVGIERNDKILSIDGFSTFGLSLDQLVSHMRGEPGTFANLSLLRAGGSTPIDIKLAREIIEVNSVEAREHHEDGLHYLQLVIDSFASRTGKEVADAIRQFRRKYPLHGVILDLRSNPGGLLDQSVVVSDIFLKQGVIVSTQGRRNEIEKVTEFRGKQVDFPVVVLMNEDSASASEIVAGALQDNGRAVVIGQKSFGKGSVQTLFELPHERALKLTIARYFTPSNRSIQNLGITPDILLQPVYQKLANSNLFGRYRYRGEAFLPNHLIRKSEDQKAMDQTTGGLLTGYYIQRSEIQDENKSKDINLELSKLIFSKSKHVYGEHLPEGAQRSSHLLALAKPELESRLNAMSDQVQKYLNEKYSLDWSNTIEASSKEHLTFQVQSNSLSAKLGQSVDIPWTVTNAGSFDAKNVSVFVYSQQSTFEMQEILVGSVHSQSTKSGVFTLKVPANLEVGVHNLSFGVAMNAIPINNLAATYNISVNPNEFSKIEVSAAFQDEAGTIKNGILDQSEKASIILKIKNLGSSEVRNLTFQTINLSGNQVELLKSKIKPIKISSGQILEVPVGIRAASRLVTDVIKFGYVVESPDLFENVTKVSEILTDKNKVASVNSAKLSH